MQDALADESVTIEKKGVKIEMNGNMSITNITIPDDMSNEKLGGVMKDCINDAIKKTQRIMAQKMQEMGGFPGM